MYDRRWRIINLFRFNDEDINNDKPVVQFFENDWSNNILNLGGVKFIGKSASLLCKIILSNSTNGLK